MVDTGPNRPGVQTYQADGRYYVDLRISKLGDCPRAIAAVILGEQEPPPSEALTAAAKEGHLHEDAVAAHLAEDWHMELRDRQLDCTYEYSDVLGLNFILRGRSEGIWYLSGEPAFAWENKSKSENQFKEWMRSLDGYLNPTFSRHPSHAWQISQYMLCHQLPVMYTVKNRNTGELNVSWLYVAPYTESDIRARLESIARIVVAGPQALHDNSHCDPQANKWFCPFRDILSCARKNADLDGVEEVDDYELDAQLMLYVSHREDETRAKKAKEKLGKEIKAKVGGGKVLTPGGYVASISHPDERDWDAVRAFLAQHGKRLEDFKKKGSRLNVSGPK